MTPGAGILFPKPSASAPGTRFRGLLAGIQGARNVRVPVDESALRILLPGPDMERVEGREAEAIRAVEQMKELSHELGRAGMRLIPRIGENQVVGADQLEVSAGGRLVDYDLGTGGIDDAAVYQRSVYIMESHGALVGAGDAAELKGVALGLGHVHILKTLGGLAHD